MTDPTPPQPARTIPVRTAPPVPPARSGKPAPVTGPWRPSMLMVAPHRLAFWLAMLILVVASGWWLLVQEDRVHGWFGLGYAVSPTLTHAAAMVFGFMPLFFAGFGFTARPKWLQVQPLAGAACCARRWCCRPWAGWPGWGAPWRPRRWPGWAWARLGWAWAGPAPCWRGWSGAARWPTACTRA